MPRVELQVFLDGVRDTTHQCDDIYDSAAEAADFVVDALEGEAVSEVRLVKLPSN